MIDIPGEIQAIQRETGRRSLPQGDARVVLLRRTYDAAVEDVWDACTDPERLARWFLPVSGDLRLGGTYQLEGNAGGRILRCEPPRLLAVSWVFGQDPETAPFSEVELRLAPGDGGSTVFELEHLGIVDPEMWAQFGPGAVGGGWDLTLLGLGLHLQGESIDDKDAWPASAEGRDFVTRSSEAWGAAMRADGATVDEAVTAAENTARFYTGDDG